MTTSERMAGVRTQQLCAYSGPAFLIVCFVGLLMLCGFVPPPSPADTMQETAALFRADLTQLRLGLILMVTGSAFLAPFISVISVQMKRIEGPRSPLTYVQLVLGACLVIEFILPMMAMQAAAFRADRAEGTVQALNDWGWMTFYGVTCTAVLEAIVIGVAILQDAPEEPVFPRWSGYFNIWVGIMFAPGMFLVFFKTGPLAWDGVFVFWVPFGTFFLWVVVMTALLVKAAARPDRSRSAQQVARNGAEEPAPEQLALHSRQLAEMEQKVGDMERRLQRLTSAAGRK